MCRLRTGLACVTLLLWLTPAGAAPLDAAAQRDQGLPPEPKARRDAPPQDSDEVWDALLKSGEKDFEAQAARLRARQEARREALKICPGLLGGAAKSLEAYRQLVKANPDDKRISACVIDAIYALLGEKIKSQPDWRRGEYSAAAPRSRNVSPGGDGAAAGDLPESIRNFFGEGAFARANPDPSDAFELAAGFEDALRRRQPYWVALWWNPIEVTPSRAGFSYKICFTELTGVAVQATRTLIRVDIGNDRRSGIGSWSVAVPTGGLEFACNSGEIQNAWSLYTGSFQPGQRLDASELDFELQGGGSTERFTAAAALVAEKTLND